MPIERTGRGHHAPAPSEHPKKKDSEKMLKTSDHVGDAISRTKAFEAKGHKAPKMSNYEVKKGPVETNQ